MIVSGATTPQNLEVCQTVSKMSVNATDNVGITAVNLRIYNPDNVLVNSTFMYRTAGTAQSGTWANDWVIPCSGLIGKYRVSVQALDAAGNATPWGDIPNFWVTSSTIKDQSPPAFISGFVSPGPIVVGQTIPEVSARFTDDVGVFSVTFSLINSKGVTVETMMGLRSSGTKIDGIYKNNWATKSTYEPGRYAIYVQASDEWQKTSGLKLVGYIDLSSSPTTPADAVMKVTPYYTISTANNGALYAASSVTLKAKSSALFVASTLFANGNNSGLLSLGHLLEVSTSTPAVCSVTGVTTWDRTGGIYTRATVNALSAGTCSVTWKFLGSTGRAATSTTMDVKVTL